MTMTNKQRARLQALVAELRAQAGALIVGKDDDFSVTEVLDGAADILDQVLAASQPAAISHADDVYRAIVRHLGDAANNGYLTADGNPDDLDEHQIIHDAQEGAEALLRQLGEPYTPPTNEDEDDAMDDVMRGRDQVDFEAATRDRDAEGAERGTARAVGALPPSRAQDDEDILEPTVTGRLNLTDEYGNPLTWNYQDVAVSVNRWLAHASDDEIVALVRMQQDQDSDGLPEEAPIVTFLHDEDEGIQKAFHETRFRPEDWMHLRIDRDDLLAWAALHRPALAAWLAEPSIPATQGDDGAGEERRGPCL